MIGAIAAVAIALTLFLSVAFALTRLTHDGSEGERGSATALAPPIDRRTPLRMLDNAGFRVGYDTQKRRAAWVAYRVRALGTYHHLPRPDFAPDPRLAQPSPTAVYAGPRYDRGHLAPNYAISQLYGASAQRQTFYYSNVAPQRPRLNQLVWQRLEEIEIDDMAPRAASLFVVVGPIWHRGARAPAAFFRVWVARSANGNAWRSLAFVVPQTVRGDERLDAFLVSIDRIESLTGLDFFAGLAQETQRRLEATPASPETLGFAGFACQPARYGRRWQDRGGVHLRYDRCG